MYFFHLLGPSNDQGCMVWPFLANVHFWFLNRIYRNNLFVPYVGVGSSGHVNENENEIFVNEAKNVVVNENENETKWILKN